MVTGLFRIILALRHVGIEIEVGRRDWAVVSHLSESGEQDLDKLFAVDRIFKRKTYINIVKGCNVQYCSQNSLKDGAIKSI